MCAAVAAVALAQGPATDAPYTVLTKEGRRPLPTRTISGQEMFSLDDLAKLFELTVREDTLAGGLTVSTRGQTIVLTAGQGLASVGGRLISLPAPPVREGRTWFVPVDFVPRALAPAAGTRLELRKPSRLILSGDVRAPRVAGTVEPLGALARVTLDVAPSTPHTVAQDGNRLLIKFEADALDATLPASTAPEIVQALRMGDGPIVVIDLGPRFASYKASDMPGDRGAVRIVVDVIAQTTGATPTPAPGTAPRPLHPRRRGHRPRQSRRRCWIWRRLADCGLSSSTPGTAAKKKAPRVRMARSRRTSRSACRGG